MPSGLAGIAGIWLQAWAWAEHPSAARAPGPGHAGPAKGPKATVRAPGHRSSTASTHAIKRSMQARQRQPARTCSRCSPAPASRFRVQRRACLTVGRGPSRTFFMGFMGWRAHVLYIRVYERRACAPQPQPQPARQRRAAANCAKAKRKKDEARNARSPPGARGPRPEAIHHARPFKGTLSVPDCCFRTRRTERGRSPRRAMPARPRPPAHAPRPSALPRPEISDTHICALTPARSRISLSRR